MKLLGNRCQVLSVMLLLEFMYKIVINIFLCLKVFIGKDCKGCGINCHIYLQVVCMIEFSCANVYMYVFSFIDYTIKYFYNSDYTFSKRLYGTLDVDIVHVSLPQTLKSIISEPELYLNDNIPKPAFNLLMNLHEVHVHFVIKFRCIRMIDLHLYFYAV